LNSQSIDYQLLVNRFFRLQDMNYNPESSGINMSSTKTDLM
jgi:hypothetical protein